MMCCQVLLDLDGYWMSALTLTTTAAARVQMTNVSITTLSMSLGGMGFVDISSTADVQASLHSAPS